MTEPFERNVFDDLNDKVNGIEGSFVNFITALAPWLAPLAPAYMTYDHMLNVLLFDNWLAWVLAGVVEILGFSTVSTGLQFWFFNRANVAKKKKAPLGLVIISFLFYLVLVIVSNVAIDMSKTFDLFPKDLEASVLLVRAMLTLQTIPAALIVAARTGHKELIDEFEREKRAKEIEKIEKEKARLKSVQNDVQNSVQNEQKNEHNGNSVHPEQSSLFSEVSNESKSEKTYKVLNAIVQATGKIPSVRELAERADVSVGTVSPVIHEYICDNGKALFEDGVITEERWKESCNKLSVE